jgi:DNA replication and repair protein RecF
MSGADAGGLHLGRLSVRNLRIIVAADLQPAPGLNLVLGPNASGKTSLLEAIYLLGRGRGLRGRSLARLLRNGCVEMQVSGEVREPAKPPVAVGFQRHASETRIRIAGRAANSALELATLLPLQFIHPDLHQLLVTGSLLRRQFIDRGLFHVEPAFLGEWRSFQRTLRQRNAGLKSGQAPFAWDTELVRHGLRLHALRDAYVTSLSPYFVHYSTLLLDRDDVALHYRGGWSTEQTYAEALQASRNSDLRYGYTHRGPHRADFALRVAGLDVRERVSRGQQKMLLCALQLAQTTLQLERTGRAGLVLVDDLSAELDEVHRERLLGVLSRLGVQAWVTTTDRTLVQEAERATTALRLFHVEHGSVQAVV